MPLPPACDSLLNLDIGACEKSSWVLSWKTAETLNVSFLQHTPLEIWQRPFIKTKQMKEEKRRS